MKLFKRFISLALATFIVISSLSLVFAENEKVKLTVATADEWTELFFRTNEQTKTWLGADGIFSVSLDGNDGFASSGADTNTVFFFSDTLMGKSDENGLLVGGSNMPSHTSALLSGYTPDKNNLEFIYGARGNMQIDQHLFRERRWLLDCLVVKDNLYVFGFPERDWKPTQIDMYTVPIKDGEPDYKNFKTTYDISQLFRRTSDDRYLYAYGIGIMCNTKSAGAPDPDGYIYIYGYRDAMKEMSRKDLIVSRVKESDFPDFSKTEYWDGENWVTDIEKSAPVIQSVSCEMSVTPIPTGPYKDKYIAIYTKNTEGKEVCYAIGDAPYGPFEKSVTFYNCPEYKETSADGKGWIYTYNAKAHPHLSRDDKLLVSYNCNARDYDTQHPADYHPRFLWLDLDPENDNGEKVDYSINPYTPTAPDGVNPLFIVIPVAVVAVTVILIIIRKKKGAK